MTDAQKLAEIHAWFRFIVGAVAIGGVVWGASGNLTTLTNLVTVNSKAIANLVVEDANIKVNIKRLEMNGVVVETKQNMIIESLERIENRLGTK